MKKIFKLFVIMFKIGLFTFGGGYAMIALLERELVGRKWLDKDEFMDMVAIAESTPGPVAINAATYVGYKIKGFLGALTATIAVCIPSFTIIFLISLFFNRFLELKPVAAAFRGIQTGVVFLIAVAGIRLLKRLEKTVFNIVVMLITLTCMLFFSFFAVDFTSVFYILLSAAAGVFAYLAGYLRKRAKGGKK